MRGRYLAAAVAACLTIVFPVRGQDATDQGPQLGEAATQKLQVGIVVSAAGGPCTGIVGTTPVPIDWPEQQVRIVDEEVSPFVRRLSYRLVSGTVKQMVVEIPRLPAGEVAKALVTFEITRHALVAPADTSLYIEPKKMDRLVRSYLGDSPYIESRHAKIRGLAKDIVNDKQGAWTRVEAMYDWVRDNVTYQNGPLKGALKALQDGNGDCEELSSLFIALCRANGIPARTVWVPGHCYPEFYLEDSSGAGHWFPCQAAGARAFGGIPEHRPILQKGDNFRVPERPRDRQRYVAEFLTGTGGQPQVQFIRETVQ